jgi:hypothetical protein
MVEVNGKTSERDLGMPGGRINHVLEVQDGSIDLWGYLKAKLDPMIEKKIQEVQNVGN